MAAGHRAKVGGNGADRLDARFLVVRDDRDRGFARTARRPAHLDPRGKTHRTSRHFRLKTRDRAAPGSNRTLCGLTSCAAKILHTVPWARLARLGWPASGPVIAGVRRQQTGSSTVRADSRIASAWAQASPTSQVLAFGRYPRLTAGAGAIVERCQYPQFGGRAASSASPFVWLTPHRARATA